MASRSARKRAPGVCSDESSRRSPGNLSRDALSEPSPCEPADGAAHTCDNSIEICDDADVLLALPGAASGSRPHATRNTRLWMPAVLKVVLMAVIVFVSSISFFGFSDTFFKKDVKYLHRSRRAMNSPFIPDGQQCLDLNYASIAFDRPFSSSDYLSILNILNEESVKATFHITASDIKASPENADVLLRIFRQGHVVGLHAEFSEVELQEPGADKKPAKDTLIGKALIAQSEIIYAVIQRYPRFLRIHSDNYLNRTGRIAERLGFVINWWTLEAENEVCTPISEDKAANTIVVNSCVSGEALKAFINDTVENKHVFVPIDTCLGYSSSALYRASKDSLGYQEQLTALNNATGDGSANDVTSSSSAEAAGSSAASAAGSDSLAGNGAAAKMGTVEGADSNGSASFVRGISAQGAIAQALGFVIFASVLAGALY